MNWETLDAIADSVNPVLGVIALVWPWLRWRGSRRQPAFNVIATLLSVAFAYAMSALDAKFGWWAYVAVMLYQRYHTVADIVTTALVIGPPLILYRLWRLRDVPKSSAAPAP